MTNVSLPVAYQHSPARFSLMPWPAQLSEGIAASVPHPSSEVSSPSRTHAHAPPQPATATTCPGHGVDHQRGGSVTLGLTWPLAHTGATTTGAQRTAPSSPPPVSAASPQPSAHTRRPRLPAARCRRPPARQGGALRMTQKGETRRSSGTPRASIGSLWKFFQNIIFNKPGKIDPPR